MKKGTLYIVVITIIAIFTFWGCKSRIQETSFERPARGKGVLYKELRSITSEDFAKGKCSGEYFVFDDSGFLPDSGFISKASTAVEISKALIKEHYGVDAAEDTFQVFLCDRTKWIVYGPINADEKEIRHSYYVEIRVADGSILKLAGFK